MEIVKANPPNIAQIRQAFKLDGPEWQSVYFAYGNRIYNPKGGVIHPSIIAHEEVHGRQHAEFGSPEKWWERYIEDKAFRLEQEIPAYQAEYRWWCDDLQAKGKPRNARARFLEHIALKMSGEIYGPMISYGKAVAQIRRI